MRLALPLLAAAGLLWVGAAQADGTQPRSGLAKYQGASPSQIWADPQFQAALAKTLTPTQIAWLTAGQGAPAFSAVARTDDHLIFSGYAPGQGFANGAVLLISLKDGSVQACWSQNGRDAWLAPGTAPRPLTQSACVNDTESLLSKYGV